MSGRKGAVAGSAGAKGGAGSKFADIRARVSHVELATRDDFQDLFVESLGF